MGNCQYGDKCTYAHGDKDLRKAAGTSIPQNNWVPVSGAPLGGQTPAMPQIPQPQPTGYPVLAAGLPVTAFPALGATSGQPNTQ